MQSMVRPDEDFGKDLGLIHEAVVTGRKVGANRELWAKLAHDQALFSRVVEAAMAEDVSVFRSPVGKISLAPLAMMLSIRFNKPIDVDSFPPDFTEENLCQWTESNWKPAFFPDEGITEERELPGWTKSGKWFYEQVRAGKIGQCFNVAPTKLIRGWYLIDTTPSVDYTDSTHVFPNDPFASIITRLREEKKIGGYENTPPGSRFSITNDEWREVVCPAIAEEYGFRPEQVRLERAIELNAAGNLYDPNRGRFNALEWFLDPFEDSCRLCGGSRGRGGLSDVDYFWAGSRGDGIAGRPLVSFAR